MLIGNLLRYASKLNLISYDNYTVIGISIILGACFFVFWTEKKYPGLLTSNIVEKTCRYAGLAWLLIGLTMVVSTYFIIPKPIDLLMEKIFYFTCMLFATTFGYYFLTKFAINICIKASGKNITTKTNT